ncbi:hypothetical protein QBC39DRAFT_27673 [Podospora conica]|nr:hypothetical protein QBC39DRAFT_27673 [Schizothecium conicum]
MGPAVTPGRCVCTCLDSQRGPWFMVLAHGSQQGRGRGREDGGRDDATRLQLPRRPASPRRFTSHTHTHKGGSELFRCGASPGGEGGQSQVRERIPAAGMLLPGSLLGGIRGCKGDRLHLLLSRATTYHHHVEDEGGGVAAAWGEGLDRLPGPPSLHPPLRSSTECAYSIPPLLLATGGRHCVGAALCQTRDDAQRMEGNPSGRHDTHTHTHRLPLAASQEFNIGAETTLDALRG